MQDLVVCKYSSHSLWNPEERRLLLANLAKIIICTLSHFFCYNSKNQKQSSCQGKIALTWVIGHCRGHCSIPFINCKEPRCDTGQSNVLHHHHCRGLILQIYHLQHLQDLALPHEGNSWSKHFTSSPAWTTATHYWLDFLPTWLNLYSVSRTCSTPCVNYQNSPMWPPSSVTSTGSL